MTAEIKGLHVLTDREIVKPKPLLEVVGLVIKGGVSVIQLRDKNIPKGDMIILGKELRTLTQGKCLLIVNDNVDVALEIGADGVHVGQKDTSAIEARKIIGKNMILGVSASTVAQAKKAQNDGADYLGVGPVFPTSTKTDADPIIGLKGLADIKNTVSIPVIAIGGINVKNAKEVAKIADGIAVVSAIMSAADPQQATRELLSLILSTRK